uniref:Uncharacterized protein n=1 Tax=Parascaris equorum TaxID=6256 RepID=A0A914RSI0_PAREQ
MGSESCKRNLHSYFGCYPQRSSAIASCARPIKKSFIDR